MNFRTTNWRKQRANKRRMECVEPHERWMISYADLVTLLFALFVVLYAAADHERASQVAQAVTAAVGNYPASSSNSTDVSSRSKPINNTRAAIERTFTANPALRSRARILESKDGFTVSLAEAGFFAPGDATVRDDARTLIETVADALLDSPAQLRIEGHTDSMPISTSQYPSNWELSSARASVVLGQFLARGFPPSRLALAGYAGERPIADNTKPEGRALNRRVDLVILHGRE